MGVWEAVIELSIFGVGKLDGTGELIEGRISETDGPVEFEAKDNEGASEIEEPALTLGALEFPLISGDNETEAGDDNDAAARPVVEGTGALDITSPDIVPCPGKKGSSVTKSIEDGRLEGPVLADCTAAEPVLETDGWAKPEGATVLFDSAGNELTEFEAGTNGGISEMDATLGGLRAASTD